MRLPSPARFVGAGCAVAAALALAGCTGPSGSGADTAGVEQLRAEIVASHPFDATSFTQGLEVDADGESLLVSTGWEGESRVYRTTVDGKQSDSHAIDTTYFGEGLSRTGDHVWELTWKNGVAIRRDAATLAETGQARYTGEGWGLCSFPDRLIMSDGTDQLQVRDPETFGSRGAVTVTQPGETVSKLNELECVSADQSGSGRDEVYANIFLSSKILRIDAENGQVTGVIDASNLPNNAKLDPNNVLNGIAHIPGTDRFYLTGKRWPDLYEVRFISEG